MAEIKILKIGSDGFNTEHNSGTDDIVFNNITAGTQLAVTSGVTITSNISFNAVTDTIAGIQNQNLLDKTASESISGNWTIAGGSTLTITDAPTNATDATNKAYVDSVASGLDWQDSVADKDLNAAPGAPTTGDRYIVASGVASGDLWFGSEEKIAEWNGSSWDFTTPNEGFATYVEDEDVIYIYNGAYDAGTWVKGSSTTNHNDLAGLQGGNGSTEYYHMTSAEDTWLAAAIIAVPTGSNLVDKSGTETISGNWTFTGTVTMTNGDLVLPGSAMGSPVEGSVYWDGTSDKLYLYNGSSYVDVTGTGDANRIVETFTAGAGGISQYYAVYISGNNTVLPADADAISTAKVIGVAPTAISAASSDIIVRSGTIANAINGLGASAGDPIWLSTTAGTLSTSIPTGSGDVVIRVGWAKNTTDLIVDIGSIRRRA